MLWTSVFPWNDRFGFVEESFPKFLSQIEALILRFGHSTVSSRHSFSKDSVHAPEPEILLFRNEGFEMTSRSFFSFATCIRSDRTSDSDAKAVSLRKSKDRDGENYLDVLEACSAASQHVLMP